MSQNKLVKYTLKQRKATENFFNPQNRVTFGNIYQSCLAAGFAKSYAHKITGDPPVWLQEIKKTLTKYDPEHIYLAFQDVATNGKQDRDRLKALELMGKARGMFIDRVQQDIQVKFINDVPRPESERKIVEAE